MTVISIKKKKTKEREHILFSLFEVLKEVIVKQNKREDVEDVEMSEEVEMWR